MRRAFYGKPRMVAADGPVPVTPIERARIEQNIATLIDLLDAMDAPDQDIEDGDDDCCRAEEWPLPNVVTARESDDDEEDDDGEPDTDREPSDGTESGSLEHDLTGPIQWGFPRRGGM